MHKYRCCVLARPLFPLTLCLCLSLCITRLISRKCALYSVLCAVCSLWSMICVLRCSNCDYTRSPNCLFSRRRERGLFRVFVCLCVRVRAHPIVSIVVVVVVFLCQGSLAPLVVLSLTTFVSPFFSHFFVVKPPPFTTLPAITVLFVCAFAESIPMNFGGLG